MFLSPIYVKHNKNYKIYDWQLKKTWYFNSKKYGIAIKRITFNYKKGVWLMKVLKWYAPTDQQEITDIALHYVFEAEAGAKEYTIFASKNPDFVNGMELTV